MSTTYTKSRLIEMNSDRTLGFNWIKNIDNIGDTMLAKIYPTGDAGMMTGRIYMAFPANYVLTTDDIKKYNLWL